ncbi:uncharacterized protein LOC114828585 [Galendromus occidentalis]|uniref:Uncharacterized protein LOC114828585 n=1 Tax=Galendromus occidentalis TaxID=34638 RepID=A0AAJ7WJD7_9ACAR|nr:uncharacterized protein LOC114828585 [Galendromus occidentalis]
MAPRMAQRPLAQRVSRAYCTVSAVAALVLARMVPWDLLPDGRTRCWADHGKERETASQSTLRAWQEELDAGMVGNSIGKWTKELIRDIRGWVDSKYEELNYEVKQVLKGHGQFQTFTASFGRSESDMCVLCDSGESDRELEVLTDIQKMVSDRPLTHISNDLNEVLPLRPSDLLYGVQVGPALPETMGIINSAEHATAEALMTRWKHQQNIRNDFWKRFRKECIQHLRTAHMSKPVRERPIKIGDVVLLDDPAASRSYWPMGRVTEFSGREGPDGKRRTCMVKLPSGKSLRRPIQLLYPLDIAHY